MMSLPNLFSIYVPDCDVMQAALIGFSTAVKKRVLPAVYSVYSLPCGSPMQVVPAFTVFRSCCH